MFTSIKKNIFLSIIFSMVLVAPASTIKSASWVQSFFGERFLERLSAAAKISGADLLSTGANYSARSAFRQMSERSIVETFNKDGVGGVLRLMAEYGIRLTPAFILRMFGVVGEEDGRASLAQARRRINNGDREHAYYGNERGRVRARGARGRRNNGGGRRG